MIDFVALGRQALPGVPALRCLPLAEPHCAALYLRRREAVDTSPGEWMCFVDGDEDALSPEFAEAMSELAAQADREGVPIGWAAESRHGEPDLSGRPHHGVVCSVRSLRDIDWPNGTYHWEAIAYGVLRAQGYVFDPVPRYDWRPGPAGARTWPSTRAGIVNASDWLVGAGLSASLPFEPVKWPR